MPLAGAGHGTGQHAATPVKLSRTNGSWEILKKLENELGIGFGRAGGCPLWRRRAVAVGKRMPMDLDGYGVNGFKDDVRASLAVTQKRRNRKNNRYGSGTEKT